MFYRYLSLHGVRSGLISNGLSSIMPHALDISDSNIAEKWNEWKEMWLHYIVVAKVNKEDGEV